VLSRITEPTEGKVGIKGRIASLLEVGTGFHQELTGRENVFLNGAILGMSRREVRSKFDQIVDFAGVERFLDTPVKRYSSGMYVRLAFSVAAHLEPEIMIVDEVLAVGDAGFQKKCMGKMQSVANEGRTVLFVSHQMSAIEKLCQRALIMDAGRIVYDGSVDSAVQKYLEGTTIPTYSDLKTRTDRKGVGGIRFERVSFLNAAKQEHSQFSSANGFYVRIEYRLKEQGVILRGARFSVSIKNRGNVLILLSSELTTVDEIVIKQSGFVEVFVPRLPLTPQHYSVDVFCEAANEIQDWIEDAAEFEVTSGDFYGTGRTAPPGWEGRVALVDHRWDFDGQSGAT